MFFLNVCATPKLSVICCRVLYPGHCRLQTARIRRQKKNTCFKLRCCDVFNWRTNALATWCADSIWFWEDAHPFADGKIFAIGNCADQEWHFGRMRMKSERNWPWKWCSDIGIIFKSFSISASILQVVQPSPKVKIGFSGTGPWSFAEEFLPSRTHGSPCGAMLSWTWMESMCWKMTFFFFLIWNILYGMMWMLTSILLG